MTLLRWPPRAPAGTACARCVPAMQQHRHIGRVAILSCLTLALGAACNGAATGPTVGPTAAATPRSALASPTPEPTSAPIAAPVPAATPSTAQAPGGLRALLPLAGEYAVTANLDDRSLSLIPIGAATVAGTVQLDLAPTSVGAA